MAFTEILTAHSLTVEQWQERIYKEFIGQTWWMNKMGPSSDAPIQIIEDLARKPGDAITVQLRGLVEGGHVTGNNKGIGNEGRLDFYGQRITIDNTRETVKVEDVPMGEQRVNFSLLNQAREALQDKAKIQFEDDITGMLTDTSTGRVRGRYLYGAADSNWNATHATALTAVDNTSDQLTTDMISIAKRKARIPVNATARIRPSKIKTGISFEEWFTFVGHTYATRDMVNNDAAWRNAQLNIPPTANGMNPIFTGTSFKGSWDGVLVYEYDRLPLVSSTIQVCHNVLLGAQAGAVVFGQRPIMRDEDSDFGHDVSFELHAIRGQAKLVFDRSTTEDHGLVNVFSAAVAD